MCQVVLYLDPDEYPRRPAADGLQGATCKHGLAWMGELRKRLREGVELSPGPHGQRHRLHVLHHLRLHFLHRQRLLQCERLLRLVPAMLLAGLSLAMLLTAGRSLASFLLAVREIDPASTLRRWSCGQPSSTNDKS